MKCYEDCVDNLILTNADGIMSAEGLLDDPALFLRQNSNSKIINKIENGNGSGNENDDNKNKSNNNDNKKSVKNEEICFLEELINVDKKDNKNGMNNGTKSIEKERNLNICCPDRLSLGFEYLELVDKYPVKMKSVIFHIRRICRDEFTDFQLMEDCLACKNTEELKKIIKIAIDYKKNKNFIYDKNKEKKAKDAYDKRKREEGKRKEFEARMIRKAKREKKDDLHFYLTQGSENPTSEKLIELKKLPKEIGFEIWKNNYSQHCYNFHFELIGCHRDRTCSFLHHDTTFADENAVAYG